jgi:hypothetical protein
MLPKPAPKVGASNERQNEETGDMHQQEEEHTKHHRQEDDGTPSYCPESSRCRLMLWLHCSDDAWESPNDPKLSDTPERRGTCVAGGKVAVEAGAVTRRRVRCSAWLRLSKK